LTNSTASSKDTGGQPATRIGCHPSTGAEAMFAASDTAMPNPNAAQTTHCSRRLRPEPRMSAVDASNNSPSTDNGHRPALVASAPRRSANTR
jgi:hypothetical protein